MNHYILLQICEVSLILKFYNQTSPKIVMNLLQTSKQTKFEGLLDEKYHLGGEGDWDKKNQMKIPGQNDISKKRDASKESKPQITPEDGYFITKTLHVFSCEILLQKHFYGNLRSVPFQTPRKTSPKNPGNGIFILSKN